MKKLLKFPDEIPLPIPPALEQDRIMLATHLPPGQSKTFQSTTAQNEHVQPTATPQKENISQSTTRQKGNISQSTATRQKENIAQSTATPQTSTNQNVQSNPTARKNFKFNPHKKTTKEPETKKQD